jgi:hypothetical protein
MRLQILKLVLWPREKKFWPRIVPFSAGMVNVISGASKTGKSSVIPIIDYCLGSERCSVPVRTIRKACSWFGVLIQTSEGEKLLARREPEDQVSTGDMFLLEGETVSIPDIAPQKNTNVDVIKRMLDRLAGLSNLSFDPSDTKNGFKARPGFRDLLAFSFQPQNIVANPDVLFFKADTNEHREKLRTIFPYVLGASTPELLAKKWELDGLMKELRRKERELSAEVSVSETWKADLINWIAEAHELGLLKDSEYDFRKYTEERLVSLLRAIIGRTSKDAIDPTDGIEGSSDEYVRLLKRESDESLNVSIIRRRLDQINSLKGGVSEYSNGLKEQRNRLGLSRWMRESAGAQGSQRCPICKGGMDEAHKELNQLCDALAVIESANNQILPAPAAFDRELVEVKTELRTSVERLKAVRMLRRAHEERSKSLSDARLQSSYIDRFLGRAEQALKMFMARTVDQGLLREVEALRESVSELRREISEAAQQRKIDAALERISNIMGQINSSLDAEQPDDPSKLDIKELTVKVGSEAGREDYLWEMGSGANWLSYHVSATIALQRFFLNLEDSSVPNFLIYDQPSQVYFPRRLAGHSENSTSETEDIKIKDEDIDSIRRFFDAFGKAVTKSGGKLQIIVLDHAGSEVWGNLEGVTLVEEWRGKNKLVPIEWLADAQ